MTNRIHTYEDLVAASLARKSRSNWTLAISDLPWEYIPAVVAVATALSLWL